MTEDEFVQRLCNCSLNETAELLVRAHQTGSTLGGAGLLASRKNEICTAILFGFEIDLSPQDLELNLTIAELQELVESRMSR